MSDTGDIVEVNFTNYESLLREIYFGENVKRGLQNMIELNDCLDKPLDNVSVYMYQLCSTAPT